MGKIIIVMVAIFACVFFLGAQEASALAPKTSISLPVFQTQFQEILDTQFNQLKTAKKDISQAIENEDFASAWKVYNQEIEVLVNDIYEKGNIRLQIENAQRQFTRKELIRQAKNRHAKKSQAMQEKIQTQGAAVIIEPLLEEGRKYVGRKIRSAVFSLREEVELIASSQIEGLRLISNGVFTQENLLSPMIGHGVAGELLLANKKTIHFMLFFDENGTLAKIFIRKHMKSEDEGKFAGNEPQGSVFVDILNGEFKDKFFKQHHHEVMTAIKQRIAKDAAQFDGIENQLRDARHSYQILRPPIHDDHSRQHMENELEKMVGIDQLTYFMAESKFSIPADAVYLRNLDHPQNNGRAGGVETEGLVFTNDKVFAALTLVHEATHAFFEELYLKIDPSTTRGVSDDRLVYERNIYYKLRAYFLKSHLHGWLRHERLYEYIYGEQGEIVNEFGAVTEALAYTVDAVLSFRGHGMLGVSIKLKDIAFLVENDLLPGYMLPAGLYEDFQEMSEKDATPANYYLPLVAYLYKTGEQGLAKQIFSSVARSHHEVTATAITTLSKLAEDEVLREIVLLSIQQVYAREVKNSRNLMGLDTALLSVLSVSLKHGLSAETSMLWNLLKENAGNNPYAFIRLVSDDLPDAVNKGLVREFLKHASAEQINNSASTFFKKMMQGDSLATHINTALFKKDADLMPGRDEQLYDYSVTRQTMTSNNSILVEQGI